MESILNLAVNSAAQVLATLQHNWPYLVLSVVIATLLKLYVDAEKVSAFLKRFRGAGVIAATAAAVATPLCSCGTTAVILGMMASSMSWAPIVAFMVASPLSSPEELVYSAGLFGWPFALTFYLASILLGLVGGWAAAVLESRGWLANQTRFVEPAPQPCACSTPSLPASGRLFTQELPAVSLSGGLAEPVCECQPANQLSSSCGCTPAEPEPSCACSSQASAQDSSLAASAKTRVTLAAFLNELFTSGKRLLAMFVGFAFIGYFLNGLIPTSWVAAVFGSGHIYSVPLAATLGLPLYINSESSLPLIRGLIEGGMSQGSALAFMVAGAGTSIGAITGALTIARWRVIGLVVGILWAGAILTGLAFNLLVALKLF